MFHWIRRKEKNKRKEKLRIFVATDLHYLSKELTDYGPLFQTMIHQSDGKMTEYEEELLDAFVDQIKTEKPDALILTGDLTFDGAKISHRGLREKLKKLREVGIKVYVLPGNHDMCKQNDAYRFLGEQMCPEEGLTREEFPGFYMDFGYGDALSRDKDSLSYIVQPAAGIRLFFLDVNGASRYNELTRESLVWLEKQLKKATREGAICLSFSHQNLLIHNEIVSSSFLMGNYEKVRNILEKYGVPIHFSGHMHVQNIKREANITEIITSSLLISPNQYGVIAIEDSDIFYEVKQVDVSEWAKRNGSQNVDLLNFSDYARQFFFDINFKALLDGEDAEKEKEVIQFFVQINYAYYCGKSEKNVRKEELLMLWREKDEFIAEYLENLLKGMEEEHCKFRGKVRE